MAMNKTVQQIKAIEEQIGKLEKQFPKRGQFPKFEGFTIDISYGGNKHHNVERVNIGSIANEEYMARDFYDLVLKSLRGNLAFWQNEARKELKEITEILKEDKA